MYCIDCGQAQPVPDARFCPYCGAALHHPTPRPQPGELPPASPASPASPGGPALEPTATAPRPSTPRPSLPLPVPLNQPSHHLQSRLRWALWATAALLVVFIVTATWWWFTQDEPAAASEGIAVETLPPAEPAASAAQSATPQRP